MAKIFKTFYEYKSLYITSLILLLIVIIAIFAPFISPKDPLRPNPRIALLPPCWMEGGNCSYLLGTDGIGRDLLSRLIYGFQASSLIGVASVGCAVIVGIIVGLLSGYFGNYTDFILMRFVDIQLAFPIIILAVIILTMTQPSIIILIIVFTLALWPIYARVCRLWVMVEKQSYYVEAGKMMGASNIRILFKYLLISLGPLVLEVAVTDIGTIIIFESILGFLGLGIQPPTPSWGNIIADGKIYINSAWWISSMPAILIAVTVIAFTQFSDALKTASNVKRIRM